MMKVKADLRIEIIAFFEADPREVKIFISFTQPLLYDYVISHREPSLL